jgi:hypothetical protein
MFKGIGANLLSRYDTSLKNITSKKRADNSDIIRKALENQNTYSQRFGLKQKDRVLSKMLTSIN